MHIAIVGAGVSGCLVARLLASEHEVALFETADYPGGHANTIVVNSGNESIPVDTGFMVFNDRTYPNFCRLLDLLGVASQQSDMSFSVRDEATGLEYQGSSLNGLFAQRLNLARPRFLAILRDVIRFNRIARRAAKEDALPEEQTVGQFLSQCRVGPAFMEFYFLPMAAAIWSCSLADVREFPAKFMLGFFANHGLLQLRDKPQWRTIVGGSRRYVEALVAPILHSVRLSTPVVAASRTADGVEITTSDGQCEYFDQIVFATHADVTLRILTDASAVELNVLRSFPYCPNDAVLHTDRSLLPKRRQAWASWNYHVPKHGANQATVTYDLRRLQRLPLDAPLLLTLNDASGIDQSQVLRKFTYHHPAYSTSSIAAQARHGEISGVNQTHYCGAYWGYGFHEDGVRSALRVAAYFGIGLEACKAAYTTVS